MIKKLYKNYFHPTLKMSCNTNCSELNKRRECEEVVPEDNVIRIPVVNRAAVVILCDNCNNQHQKCSGENKKNKKCC